MRLLVDLSSHLSAPSAPEIIQAQRVPAIGDTTVINGKYAIPMPLDADFPVTLADYVLDGAGEIDGGDVVSKGFAQLLAAYPQYANVYFNPLLTGDHVKELVLDRSYHFTDKSVSPAVTLYSRFQTGRESGVVDAGQMPTHTALAAANNGVTPARPGLMITDEIDIGPYTLDCLGNEVGADQFLVYWKLYSFSVSHDISADYGATAGLNSPALRTLAETDQEPADLTVYITTDDGANWCPVGLLEPVAFCDKSKKIRLAFRNDGTSKVFIASYALLF